MKGKLLFRCSRSMRQRDGASPQLEKLWFAFCQQRQEFGARIHAGRVTPSRKGGVIHAGTHPSDQAEGRADGMHTKPIEPTRKVTLAGL